MYYGGCSPKGKQTLLVFFIYFCRSHAAEPITKVKVDLFTQSSSSSSSSSISCCCCCCCCSADDAVALMPLSATSRAFSVASLLADKRKAIIKGVYCISYTVLIVTNYQTQTCIIWSVISNLIRRGHFSLTK